MGYVIPSLFKMDTPLYTYLCILFHMLLLVIEDMLGMMFYLFLRPLLWQNVLLCHARSLWWKLSKHMWVCEIRYELPKGRGPFLSWSCMFLPQFLAEAKYIIEAQNAVDWPVELVYSFKTWTLEPYPVFVYLCLMDQQISLLPGLGDTHV